jgi:putative flippase GtrA
VLHPVRNLILAVIDWFHRPFSRWFDVQTFRYLACGGSNTLLEIVVYFIAYNYILGKQPLILASWLIIAPHIAAFLISFSISFPLGFALSRYVVFQNSNLRGRVQLFRYAVLVAMCILLNYLLLKAFVEGCGFYPTPSKILTTAIVAVFSYVTQRSFTFKTIPNPEA